MRLPLSPVVLFTAAVATPIFAAETPWLLHPQLPDEARSIDGSGNNLAHPDWGRAGTPLLRLTTISYADGVSAPAGPDRPSARHISNVVCAQSEPILNPAGASDYLWQWGQFIDHDTTLVDVQIPFEPMNIPVPLGDPYFDPDWLGGQWILFDRSIWDPSSGTGPDNPREQMELLTAWIDGSQVYGSDQVRADALRTFDGHGTLKTSAGDLLPYNTPGLPNFPDDSADFFLAGDIRANEQIGLTSMHTLWVREHNSRAAQLRTLFPWWTGDQIYEMARAIVGAEIQVITYKEFLPLLLGPDAIPPYDGYDPSVNGSIANAFTNAYRVGHTLLSPQIQRLDADGEPIPQGPLPLRDAFLNPTLLVDEGGIEPILRGLASQMAQNVDNFVIDDVRNFLFGPPGAGGFDLAALNVQRSRDHGLPTYNQTRVDYGLPPAVSFSDISSDPAVAAALATAYDGDIDEVELWIGAISEDHVDGALVGELLRAVVGDQFRRLRDGDRFWYQRQFAGAWLAMIENVRLSDVIRRNTDIGAELRDDVFRVATSCLGDVNADGIVNGLDMIAVITSFGASGGDADLNADGIVNVYDLFIVFQNLGPCP